MRLVDLICVASGPSLNFKDCLLIEYHPGLKIVAVNDSWRRVPSCDYLYAGDHKWWNAHYTEIDIVAERWTCSSMAAKAFGLNLHVIGGGYNSGLRAIQFGIMKGFKRIGLLGYDCSLKNGLHWHGPHAKRFLKNPTAEKVAKWRKQFAKLAEKAKRDNITILNCSRHTELECFERVPLELALGREVAC